MEWKRPGQKNAWYARTERGTAIIHDLGNVAILDIWQPDQTGIGTGRFPTVDTAKERARAILDPRTTCWDRLGDLLSDD